MPVNTDQYKIEIYKCQGCDELVEEEAASFEPLYECGACGTVFTRSNSYDGSSHCCPDCGKFSSKLSNNGCESCGEAEMEVVDGWKCPRCEELFDDEDEFINHVTEVDIPDDEDEPDLESEVE